MLPRRTLPIIHLSSDELEDADDVLWVTDDDLDTGVYERPNEIDLLLAMTAERD